MGAFGNYQSRGLQHKQNETEGEQTIETEDGVFTFPMSMNIKPNMDTDEKATFVGALHNFKHGIITGTQLSLVAEKPDIYTTFGESRAVEPYPQDMTAEEKNIIDGAAKQRKYEEKVNHPSHYTQYNGVEVIDITEQLNFNRGNAVKYIARAGFKDEDTEILDLQKAQWYVLREIKRIEDGGSEDGTADSRELIHQMNYLRGSAVDRIAHAGTVGDHDALVDLRAANGFIRQEMDRLKSYSKEA